MGLQGVTPLHKRTLKGIFDSVLRAVLAYRFQRKTQAELALKSAVFGDFRPHTPDKEHSPLTLIKFDSCLLNERVYQIKLCDFRRRYALRQKPHASASFSIFLLRLKIA